MIQKIIRGFKVMLQAELLLWMVLIALSGVVGVVAGIINSIHS